MASNRSAKPLYLTILLVVAVSVTYNVAKQMVAPIGPITATMQATDTNVTHGVVASFIQSNNFPLVLLTALLIGLFFTWRNHLDALRPDHDSDPPHS